MEKYFPFLSLDGSIIFLYTKIKRRQRCEWEKSISSAVSTHTDFSFVCCILDGKLCVNVLVEIIMWKGKCSMNHQPFVLWLLLSLKFLSFSYTRTFHLKIIFGYRIFFISPYTNNMMMLNNRIETKQPSTLHESFIHYIFIPPFTSTEAILR